MPSNSLYEWATFGIVVTAALAADLFLRRKGEEIELHEAVLESLGWIGLALLFDAWVYYSRGREAGLQFLTAYVVEKSLSIDNIFVFIVIFSSLGVPPRLQHRVLFYGVAGALVLRGIFVWAGVELLAEFHAVLYVFAAILFITGVRMLLPANRSFRPESNWLVGVAQSVFPVTNTDEDGHFFLRQNGQWKVTSLFIALMAVEAMDIIFAVDSVPAVLAISREPFVAYSSNVFAILGLRALYFALSAALTRLRFLHQGLAAILGFVATKMVAGQAMGISTGASLGIIGAIILVTVLASIKTPKRTATAKDPL
jgi:tellurite resistance protein TerC